MSKVYSVVCGLVVVTGMTARASADDCIPKGASFDLGLVGGAPVVCTIDSSDDLKGVLACWDVDATTGALHSRAAAPLPGHSLWLKHSKACAQGFCAPNKPKDEDDPQVVMATSTDGGHVALMVVTQSDQAMLVFDAKTKKLQKTIPMMGDGFPDNTQVGYTVGEIAFVGHDIYTLGAAAGPFQGVWAFKDDGTRVGAITTVANPRTEDERNDVLNIDGGGMTVLDDHRVGLEGSSLTTLTIVGDGPRVDLARKVSRGPCKDADFEPGADPKKKCAKHLRKYFTPYNGVAMIALPDGHYLGALRGDLLGTLAIFDGKKLKEKKRVKLAMCK